MNVPEQPVEPPVRGEARATGRLAKPVPLSQRGQTLVKGHALLYEGAPFDARGELVLDAGWLVRSGGQGRAKCTCGWLSGELPSGAARKRAHAAHKINVLNNAS